MALLASCFCCSLQVCCGVLGIYLLVAYVIALGIELWWITEAQEVLPVPVYLLTAEYLAFFLLSSALLYGLNVRKSTYLMVWMFLMGILLGPEAGMVLYMSIHHWRINTVYGLVEVTCWSCRLLVNATAMLCVQSLYSTWKEEKSMMLRIQALKMSPAPASHRLSVIKVPPRHEYHNNGYQHDEQKHIMANNYVEDNTFVDPFFTPPLDGPCEFNASCFDATIIEARNQPTELENGPLKQKTRSLFDIREEDYNNVENVKNSNKTISLNYVNNFRKEGEVTQSLDRRLMKNKNSRILKSLSPFLGRKSTDEVNVYQIQQQKITQATNENPMPSSQQSTNLDQQLNQIYSNRGMYAYDEKSRKLIYYPPEFFHGEMRQYRKRMPSNESSRSSMDEEDLRSRIGDVAL